MHIHGRCSDGHLDYFALSFADYKRLLDKGFALRSLLGVTRDHDHRCRKLPVHPSLDPDQLKSDLAPEQSACLNLILTLALLRMLTLVVKHKLTCARTSRLTADILKKQRQPRPSCNKLCCSLIFLGCNGTLVDPTHLAMWKALMDSGSVVKHYLLVRSDEVCWHVPSCTLQ